MSSCSRSPDVSCDFLGIDDIPLDEGLQVWIKQFPFLIGDFGGEEVEQPFPCDCDVFPDDPFDFHDCSPMCVKSTNQFVFFRNTPAVLEWIRRGFLLTSSSFSHGLEESGHLIGFRPFPDSGDRFSDLSNGGGDSELLALLPEQSSGDFQAFIGVMVVPDIENLPGGELTRYFHDVLSLFVAHLTVM